MAPNITSHHVIHSAAAAVNPLTSEEAVKAARDTRLIPQDAEIRSTRLEATRNRWVIVYAHSDTEGNFRDGTLELNDSNGNLLYFTERLNYERIFGDMMAPPFDPAEQKVSFSEAVGIAHDYAIDQSWPIEHQWKETVIPQSEYSLRAVKRDLHAVSLNRAYKGGRYLADKFDVYVDRKTGEVMGHEVHWSKTNFIIPGDISASQAAAAKYKPFQPVLDWTETNNKRLAYSLDGLTGYLTESEKNKWSPKYNQNLAKKRLLALYELEMVFTPDFKGNATAKYDFVIKQDVPLFYSGVVPAIDANTGEWVDFLGSAITQPIPPASEWLVDQAVPVGKTGYKAAVIWNNDLLALNNEPLIHNGSTLVPFRELLNKLNAKIGWDPEKRKVTANKDGISIELTIGSSTAYMNGKARQLGTPAIIQKGHTYIPARIVLEAFGAKVDWDNDSRLVLVNTDKTIPKLTPLQLKQFRFQAHINWAEKQ
ncbi:copper amine oxidase N-terminal domain-containing protein [Paenibacillus agaridevorans]|uniref:copper amine oxidase N-terminal domain-containing protein n=1 Tax=Paenibacillus agaridevorans TaxID=171404 RepID=UPI001BE3D0A6|nr:copper amine oxidase N-terminal domain-containing protein [Paenibacillus agaridevorans]